MSKAADRLLKYVSFDTQSKDEMEQVPSTEKQLVLAKELVKELDPQAFMIVTSANEIYGEGYKSFFADKF